PQSMRVLRALAACDDTEAARIARTEMARRERREAPAADGVNVEAGARWSDFLRRCRIEESFESFWANVERIDTRGSGVSGTEVLQRIQGFESAMRSKLCGGITADRIRAYDLLIALDLEERFASDLFAQAD